MTSRDRKRQRAFRATARNADRLGKRPPRSFDRRANRADHAALARWGKKQREKRRAEIAAIARRELTPARKRDGGNHDFGQRLAGLDGSIPRDVDLDIDSDVSDAAVEKSMLVREMLELLRDSGRADIRWFRKAMPAFGLDARNLDLLKRSATKTMSPHTLTAIPDRSITNRRIFRLALQTFGSNANVRRWLIQPGSWAIDYQIPAVLLKTPQGLKMLEDFLMRLEYGV